MTCREMGCRNPATVAVTIWYQGEEWALAYCETHKSVQGFSGEILSTSSLPAGSISARHPRATPAVPPVKPGKKE